MHFSYFQTWFDAAEFKRRHEKVYEAIGNAAVAVVQGGGPVGGFETFRQNNDFFYLCGVEVPQAYLVLDARCRGAILYLPHGDERVASIEGKEPCAEDRVELMALTGCMDVRALECLEEDLQHASLVYTPYAPAEGALACQDTLHYQAKLNGNDPWVNHQSREAFFRAKLKERIIGVELRDLSAILFALRLHKSAAEIRVMHQTGQLSAMGVVEAMKQTRAGMYEYQLGAIADKIFIENGARGAGYRPIIATGRNIWMMHYYRNNCTLENGEWVLMDYAPDLCNYTNDIGRMWPVNGTYSSVQRELYSVVVKYHQTLLEVLRPGVLPAEMLREAAQRMEPYLQKHPFSKAIYGDAVKRMIASDKALTHQVGLSVHDGSTYTDKSTPFKPGLVFALDPQLWVPEEELYVRVEDTVVITDQGVESFTSLAPHELDEVEALVGKGLS